MNISIEKIEITNYRSCKACTFSPHANLSALIGPNGSGKTSILRSILLMKHLVHEDPMRRIRSDVDPSTIKLTMNIDGNRIIHTANLYIDNDERNQDRIIASEQKWYMRDVTKKKKLVRIPVSIFGERARYYDHILEDGDNFQFFSHVLGHRNLQELGSKKVIETIKKVSSFYDGVTYYSASQFTDPTRCPVSIEVEEARPRRLREYEGHHKWLLDLYGEYSRKTPEYESFINIVGKNGIGLIDDIEFKEMPVSHVDYSVRVGGKVHKRNKSKRLVIPQIIISQSILSPSQLSEGTFKTLGMLFYLMTGKGSVILLEEPEVCIHHGLLSSVVELIQSYSKDKQIFVSTHSDFILDSLEESSVFVVKNDKKDGTTVNKLSSYLSEGDRDALKNFLRNEGSLGEYWRMGAIDG